MFFNRIIQLKLGNWKYSISWQNGERRGHQQPNHDTIIHTNWIEFFLLFHKKLSRNLKLQHINVVWLLVILFAASRSTSQPNEREQTPTSNDSLIVIETFSPCNYSFFPYHSRYFKIQRTKIFALISLLQLPPPSRLIPPTHFEIEKGVGRRP